MIYDTENKDIKIILLGEPGVGKTNLTNIFCNLKFNPSTKPTISKSALDKKVIINKISYNIQIWDTAGQEKYRSLNNIFIKDSRICIFVYDVSNPKSLEGLSYWVKSAKEILENKAIYGLVGNKIDLEQKINQEEGEKCAKDIDAFFLQCSAKNDKGNFEEFIIKLVNEFLRRNKLEGWEIYAKEDSVNVSAASFTKENKKKCC